MSRALLTVILPLLLPTVLYLLWAFAMRRAEVGKLGDLLRGLPWLWLSSAGSCCWWAFWSWWRSSSAGAPTPHTTCRRAPSTARSFRAT